jgi:nicotinate-nucleotide adenylyltransferase
MKIAFYLGSFNPFHNGHLKVIETAFEKYKMNKVVIVPTMQNPWKNNKVLSLFNRNSIIALSIADFYWHRGYNIVTDFIEKELEEPYYSYITLEKLKEKYSKENTELYFLCGQDTMNDVPNWYNGSTIMKEWKFLVVERPEGSISSSQIRELVKECKDITPYVSKNVVKLINKYYNN